MWSALLLALSLSAQSGAGQPVIEPRIAAAAAESPTVTPPAGPITGTSTGSVNRFLGIPYAAPPVRFDAPQPAAVWKDAYDAAQYKAACIQSFGYPLENRERTIQWFNTPPPLAGESEDCLYLNVFAPTGAEEGSKAVLFWIYGGKFAFGAGTLPQYDGSSFAQTQDVVIVTFNYRTNVFGFPGVPGKPSSEHNLGFLDIRLALDWVQRNIRAFGGDPNRVTIFGESAGGNAVETLITTPPRPLNFIGAIMQSGQSSIPLPHINKGSSWKKLVEAAKCGSTNELACIRALSASELKDLIEKQRLSFSPVEDGGATFAGTGRVDRRKSTAGNTKIARVPILIGSNTNDGEIAAYGVADTLSALKEILPASTDDLIPTLMDAYSAQEKRDPVNTQLAAILTDYTASCPSKIVAEESIAATIPSWRYVFNASFANSEIYPGSGAHHASEIPLIFGTYPADGTTYQAELSKTMQKLWADFAKSPALGPGWASAPKIAVFGAGVRAGGSSDGTGQSAMEVADSPVIIDRRCAFYKGIYDAETLG